MVACSVPKVAHHINMADGGAGDAHIVRAGATASTTIVIIHNFFHPYSLYGMSRLHSYIQYKSHDNESPLCHCRYTLTERRKFSSCPRYTFPDETGRLIYFSVCTLALLYSPAMLRFCLLRRPADGLSRLSRRLLLPVLP